MATYPIVILYVENGNYYPVLKNNKGLYSYRQNNDVRNKLIDITEDIHDEIVKEHDMEIEEEHMNSDDIEIEQINEKIYSMEELKEIAKKHKVLLTYMDNGKRKKKSQEMLETELKQFL